MVRPDERHARVGPGHSGMSVFFFFNDTATTEIYTLSLHDALPICRRALGAAARRRRAVPLGAPAARVRAAGRGGTRTRDRGPGDGAAGGGGGTRGSGPGVGTLTCRGTAGRAPTHHRGLPTAAASGPPAAGSASCRPRG